MSAVKTKRIRMLRNDRGAPEGHTVVDYTKGEIYTVREDLARAFIESGAAEELPEEGAAVMVVDSWPPSDEVIAALSFSALGVLLEGKGVALGPLKSEDARRDALREIIDSEFVPPWPPCTEPGRISDVVLARKLKSGGVDISTLKTRDEAEAKLREVLGLPEGSDPRQDGPTLTEWVSAGYSALGYPPQGYAAKPLTEAEQEMVEKAKAEKAAAEQTGDAGQQSEQRQDDSQGQQ